LFRAAQSKKQELPPLEFKVVKDREILPVCN